MSSDAQEFEFGNYQQVEMKHVLPEQDRTVSKADRKFMEKAAKAQPKEERRGWGKRGR